MTKYQTQVKPLGILNIPPIMPAVIGATLPPVAPAVANAAGEGDNMVAPAAEITLVAETETKRPGVYQDQLDDAYAKLNKNASDIRGFIEDLKDLSAMTPEKAKEVAEEVLGIATDTKSLFCSRLRHRHHNPCGP